MKHSFRFDTKIPFMYCSHLNIAIACNDTEICIVSSENHEVLPYKLENVYKAWVLKDKYITIQPNCLIGFCLYNYAEVFRLDLSSDVLDLGNPFENSKEASNSFFLLERENNSTYVSFWGVEGNQLKLKQKSYMNSTIMGFFGHGLLSNTNEFYEIIPIGVDFKFDMLINAEKFDEAYILALESGERGQLVFKKLLSNLHKDNAMTNFLKSLLENAEKQENLFYIGNLLLDLEPKSPQIYKKILEIFIRNCEDYKEMDKFKELFSKIKKNYIRLCSFLKVSQPYPKNEITDD